MSTHPSVVGVWFSFADDYSCLAQSLRAFRHVYGLDVPCCVYDDGDHPIADDLIPGLGLFHYARTSWPRRGNLNGGQCILGVLDALADAAARSGAEIVVKTDCDTVVTGNWLNSNPAIAFQGVWFDPAAFGSGAQYAMRSDVPGDMRDRLTPRLTLLTGSGSGEDNSISRMAAVWYPCELLIHDSTAHASDRIGCGYQFCDDPFDSYVGFRMITFGNRCFIPAPDPRDRREIAADHMRRYLDFLGVS